MVSELVANAVIHSGLSAEDTIGFDLATDEGTVRVSVFDDGPGFEKPANAVATQDGGSGDGGLGLAIVDRLSDRWGVNRGSPNEVWFEVDQRD